MNSITKNKVNQSTGVTIHGTSLVITKDAFPELLMKIVDSCDGDSDEGVLLGDQFGILSGWMYQGQSWMDSPRHDSDTITRSIAFTSPEGNSFCGEYQTNLIVGFPFHDVTLTIEH